MKKFLRNVTARALCVLAVGILLIVFSEDVTTWIVMLSGIAFIIPGAVAIVSYFHRDPESRQVMLYPIVGAGSILFGLVQLIWPTLFLQAIVYILCGLLIIVAATQLYTLWSISKQQVKVHPAYYILPAAELACSLYVIIGRKAEEAAGLPVIIIGSGFIVYALLELWTIVLVQRASTPMQQLPRSEE